MNGRPYDYLSLLTVDALVEGETVVSVAARLGGVVELMVEDDSDGACVVATLYAEEAFDLQRRILAAANVAANRGGLTRSKTQQERISVLLDRIRQGLATSEDADEIAALLDGQIEEIEVGRPAEAKEENEG